MMFLVLAFVGGAITLFALPLLLRERVPATMAGPSSSQGAPPVSSAGRPRVTLAEGVFRLSTAIAKFETGFRKPGPFPLDPGQWQGRAAKNLNPGNLRFGIQKRAIGKDKDDYSRFASAEDGWAALQADVRAKVTGTGRTGLGPNSTLEQFVHVYAPQSENPTGEYVKFVARELNIAPGTKFRTWMEV